MSSTETESDPFGSWSSRRRYEIVSITLLSTTVLSGYISMLGAGIVSTISSILFVGSLIGLVWSSGRASVLTVDEVVTGRDR